MQPQLRITVIKEGVGVRNGMIKYNLQSANTYA